MTIKQIREGIRGLEGACFNLRTCLGVEGESRAKALVARNLIELAGQAQSLAEAICEAETAREREGAE